MSAEEAVADGSTADDPTGIGSSSECSMVEGTMEGTGFQVVESKRQKKKRIRAEVSPVDTPGTPVRERQEKENSQRTFSSKLFLKSNGKQIDASKVSPVKIAKLLNSSLSEGVVKAVKPTRDGGLLITVNAEAHLIELGILTSLGEWEISQASQRDPSITGVISGVHKAITNEEIREELFSVIPIAKAERLEKKINGVKVATTCVAITFSASVLPLSVTMAYVVYPVRLFVPEPMQCFNCRRFGHQAKSCEARQRCARCGRDHKTESCTSKRESFRCVNCGGAHSAAFGGCPKRKEAQKIISVAQQLRIPRAEAKEKISKDLSYSAATSGKNPTPESQSQYSSQKEETREEVKQINKEKEMKKEKYKDKEAERLKRILKVLIRAILAIDSAQAFSTLQGAAKEAMEVLEEPSSDEEDTSNQSESETEPAAGIEKRPESVQIKTKKQRKKKKKRPNSLGIKSISTAAVEERPTSR